MPGFAHAASPSPLAGATLSSISYSLQIKANHCPAGVTGPADPACDHTTLESEFESLKNPAIRRIAGHGKFPSGLRITGKGATDCTYESASQPFDPSSGLLLGSALRIARTQLARTDVFVATNRRGARWAWPEPLDPAKPCENGDAVLPQPNGAALPKLVISPRVSPSTLKQRRFGTTIEASGVRFDVTKPDGSHVLGEAKWKLELTYRR
jgi:hypothetical protein